MLGPSDSGRPSSSVRSGSSCISMKSASTPTATAARASACTYSRAARPSGPACAARELHRVGRVEHDRVAERPHDRQPAEVDDQVVVAEARAALGQEHVARCPTPRTFSTTLAMSRGATNWPFFTFTGRPLARARHDQVGLAAEERGDLEHVEHLGGGGDLGDVVHVGEYRETGLLLDLPEDPEPLDEARPPIGVDRGPVGLVVGRLVDERHTRVRGRPLQALRDHQRVLLVLDCAGAADQGQRRPAPDGDGADADRPRPAHAPPWWSRAALMNAAKSGCGSHGRERNSGWNCPATNHG